MVTSGKSVCSKVRIEVNVACSVQLPTPGLQKMFILVSRMFVVER